MLYDSASIRLCKYSDMCYTIKNRTMKILQGTKEEVESKIKISLMM